MVIQYPDSISVTISASAWQNASGIPVAGASSSFTSDCRVEVNNAARKITGIDGVEMDYAFQVFMPVTTTIIPVDSDAVLTSVLNGVIRARVKSSSNGQLNSRLWL